MANIQLNKVIAVFSAAALLVGGLSACSQDAEPDTAATPATQPSGANEAGQSDSGEDVAQAPADYVEHKVSTEGAEIILKGPKDWKFSDDGVEGMRMIALDSPAAAKELDRDATEAQAPDAPMAGSLALMIAQVDGEYVKGAKQMAEETAKTPQGEDAEMSYTGEEELNGITAHAVGSEGKVDGKSVESKSYFIDLSDKEVAMLSALGVPGTEGLKKAQELVQLVTIDKKS